ncbi:Cupredoxin [Salinicola endophyticus]|uniref:Cupredoxin n=1 Tax=Salinicola endophyticus TaxID=1949083 RepID=A0ABY8FMD7_9GAMM|nr:Cupredoxin [Salinicola endophyticus]WFF41049.1 Cupredoxin [Salinicola endophyticus]
MCLTSSHRWTLSARLASLMLLAWATPAASAQLQITDAATGTPLGDAVVEVYAPSTAGSVSAAADHYQIVQRQATFIPHVLLVPVGAEVSFPNRDTTRHHVYSFSPAHPFRLDLYLQETPPPERFDHAGVVVLGCNIHDAMEAFIVVSDAPYRTLTGDDGRAIFDLPPGQHRLRVWHPRLEDTHLEWWEGEIVADQSREVALTLAASLPPVPAPSALQQRFQRALEQTQAN